MAMTYEEMVELETKQLITIYNGLSPDTPLTSWKTKKTKLVDKIMRLPNFNVPEAEPIEADEPEAEQTPSTDGESTIRLVSCALLCQIEFYEDRTKKASDENRVEKKHQQSRSVGLSYPDVLARVLEKFPEAATSIECLRWYAVKIRAQEFGYEGMSLPQRRPRAKRSK